MQIVIDIDGTICTEERTFERSMAKLLPGARDSVQELFNAGHTIILYTARGWNEYNMTKDWLDQNNVPFHQLVMGKPGGDVWIDDRAIKFTTWPKVLKELPNK